MLKALQELLFSKKNIIIATGTRHSADVIFAGLAMHLILDEAKKDNHLFCTNIDRSKIWKNRISHFPSISTSGNIPVSYSFDLPKELDIKDVKWKKEKGKYRIDIRSSNTSIDIPSIELSKATQKFDLLIFIGNKSQITYENTGLDEQSYKKIDKVLIFSKKIFIDGEPVDTSLNENKCFSYKIKELADDFELNINKDAATLLLSGMISHTDGFKKNVSSILFMRVKELLDKGVDYQDSLHLAIGDQNIKKMIFLGNLFSRTKKVAPNIYHAGLMSKTPIKIRLEVSEMMKISEIYDCKFGIISIGSPGVNRIYLHNRLKSIDLKNILNKFKGKGNNKQGVIESRRNLHELLKELYEYLDIGSEKSENKPSTIVFHSDNSEPQ